MSAAVGEYGCEIVVVKRGGLGQMVYDVKVNTNGKYPLIPLAGGPNRRRGCLLRWIPGRFRKTYDPLQAALYGNVSASLKVKEAEHSIRWRYCRVWLRHD